MKKLSKAASSFPLWILYFLSSLSKRDENILLFGVHTASLFGNVKALLLENESANVRKIYIASNSKTLLEAKALGIESYCRLSLKGIYFALKGKFYIYSSYPSDINFWLSNGAKYINVWHGTPIKKIERDVDTGYYALRNRYKSIYRILAPYLFVKPDVMLSASEYEELCFKSAFDIEDESCFLRAFAPRLVDISMKSKRKKKILYIPTWRDNQKFIVCDYINAKSLDVFLRHHDIHLGIKLHPSDTQNLTEWNFTNIEYIDKDSDVYTLLEDTSLLISDYSSIVFEALYLHIKVALFVPDYTQYKAECRAFYIDPLTALHVRVSHDQKTLKKMIIDALNEEDEITLEKRFEAYPICDTILQKLVEKASARG